MKTLIALTLLALVGCGHTAPVASVAELRDECLKASGVFRVRYGDYARGWEAAEAECWYGFDTLEDVVRVKSLREHGPTK